MNTSYEPPNQPPVPNPASLPLGQGPGENEPIARPTQAIEAMLRQPRRLVHQLRQGAGGKLIGQMVGLGIVCAAIYGVVVGMFSGGTQLWAAPVKLAFGMLAAGMICLPSLYIFACLAGSRARLVEVAGVVSGLVLLMTLLLIGFAPVAWVFSQSTNSVVAMGFLHLLFGVVALIFGMRFLSQGFKWMETQFNAGLKVWMIIFTLVVIQMTTALRPIVGTADTFLPKEKKFFLAHWFDQINGDGKLARALED
ncbi:hypothetical protein GC207_06805 [bacterium]|nr:hypothetical protein [bacterium]